jgi:hypothetical protein
MLLKKSVFLFLFSSLFFSDLVAQNNDSLNSKKIDLSTKKFYYQFGIGYNFNSGSAYFVNTTTNEDGSSSKNNFSGSLGKSFDLSFALGKKVTQNLGLEMDLGYMWGGTNTENNQFYEANSGNPLTVKQKVEYTANTFRINPKLVFEIPFAKGNAFYSKLGYMIGFGNSKATYTENWDFYDGSTGTGDYTRIRSGGLVSGSTMALGVRFNVERDLSFFMELTGNNLHRTFKRDILTASNENGKNTLSSKSVYQTQTIYVKNATNTPNPDPNQPHQYPADLVGYSTVGFKIGIVKHF